MQTTGRHYQVAFVASLLWGGGAACNDKSQSFDAAIAKHRHTLVDQVNPVGEGAPFFTVQTLNPVWRPDASTPLVTIPKLALTDQNGTVRTEALFNDKISFVGFFFATCQGFCPFLIEGLKAVEREIGPLEQAQFVALTVNPEEDTPKRLKAYAGERKLSRAWTLLTGPKDTIYALAKETFASQVFRRASPTANFVHSEHIYAIDGQGRLRGILNGTRTDLRRDAKALMTQLLAEPHPLHVSSAR